MMRSIFRRKQNDDISEEISTTRSIPSLGLFSPATESIQADPVRELKRLGELEEIFVRSKKLESLADVPYIVEEIKDGNIVLLDISRLNDGNNQTHIELRRIIERIRGATRGYQADIALVNDGCMIITPSFVKL
ncbi:cell division protein SepF [Candidatus Thorarchaeota archaeon]|nr:MAG: cell division protein SepF [Candidatus Thorarchaeota archaeon]